MFCIDAEATAIWMTISIEWSGGTFNRELIVLYLCSLLTISYHYLLLLINNICFDTSIMSRCCVGNILLVHGLCIFRNIAPNKNCSTHAVSVDILNTPWGN